MRVLVTGGLGFIGSHTCVLLAEAGAELVVVDNLSNSKPVVLERLRELTGRPIEFHRADLRERSSLDSAFRKQVDAVIHFAGLKAVGESVEKPRALPRQQRRRQRDAARGDGGERRAAHRLQLLGHRVRRARAAAAHRGPSAAADQPLRRQQGRDRAAARRRPGVHLRGAALLQPDRRASLRPHRRGPARASRTTCCRTSPRWRSASCRRCASGATTTRPPTAPACATTSTSWTSRAATSPRSTTWRKRSEVHHRQPRHRPRLLGARGGEGLRARLGKERSRSSSTRAAPATPPPPTPTPASPRASSAGKPRSTSTTCAATPGAGSRTTRRATPTNRRKLLHRIELRTLGSNMKVHADSSGFQPRYHFGTFGMRFLIFETVWSFT